MSPPLGLSSTPSAGHAISLRLDGLSRSDLDDGSIAASVHDHRVTGVATNASDFVRSLAGGSSYDAQLAQFAEQGITPDEAIAWARTDDARRACDVLAPLYESSAGFDGYVSVAVDPRCAYDTEGTLHDARRLRTVVGRDNLYVGVPATVNGVSAIQELLSEGINVDATSVYGLEPVRQVIAAHLAGLEQAAGRGRDLSRISTTLSICTAELDSEVGQLATGFGVPVQKGTVAGALAAAAGELLDQTLTGSFWAGLRARGARPLRLVWDTTVGDDADRAETFYAGRAATTGAVIAVSGATMRRLVDQGSVFAAAESAEARPDNSQRLESVERCGIQLDVVASTLAEKRIRRLTVAHAEAVRLVDAKLGEVTPGRS